MTTFSSRNRSVANVPALPDQIWEVLRDPVTLAELTPLVDRIETDGSLWRWTLAGISGLGMEIAPTFSERMTFVPTSRIEYRHEPPPGKNERAGANGTYLITQVGDSRSKLYIDITLCVELPLPGFGRRAVERIMAATMQRTGDGFASNLYALLEIDPDDVEVKVLEGASA